MSQCQSCGIQIGNNFTERVVYTVGDYSICGFCYSRLQKKGRIPMADEKIEGRRTVIFTMLHKNGTTRQAKRYIK